METIKKKCDDVILELLRFNNDMRYLGSPIVDERLELFEKSIGFNLPIDFKYMLKAHNGFSLDGTEVYGLDLILRGSSLDEIYNYEHKEVDNAMPNEFLPFSADGRGNHYCLNLSKLINGICPVVFWQHDFTYSSLDKVEECNDDFLSWIKEVMIEWTLKDYHYDGTEK